MFETNSLSHHFHQLEDPRIARSKRHSLHDILIVSICALLCGAEGFVDMEEFGKKRGVRTKQKIAAWDHRDLLKLLSI